MRFVFKSGSITTHRPADGGLQLKTWELRVVPICDVSLWIPLPVERPSS